MTVSERLSALRNLMRQHRIDYYLITNSDPHQNEYLPEAWQRYQYISGFSGSNAEVLIGLKDAYFWTDGRYTEQAKLEVSPLLFKTFIYSQGSASSLPSFIAEHLQQARIGVDPSVMTTEQTLQLQNNAKASNNELILLKDNLIDAIWQNQPKLKSNKIFVYADKYAGVPSETKLQQVRSFIQKQGAKALILNDLTSIAWLFNLRGNDIPQIPVFLSYALVTLDNATLFVNPGALLPKTEVYLKSLKVKVQDYRQFYSLIGELCPDKVILEKASSNQAIQNALSKHQVMLMHSPIALWKACKNDIEIKGAKLAHRLDAVALIRFFSWLEQASDQTEMSVADQLLRFRKMAKSFQEVSFNTIAGFGSHGAIIHYHSTPATNQAIGRDALFLLDSGGQYLEGTTDVTRTIHLGTPSELEKRCYTLVLKGHLALKNAIFAAGTRGEQLDILARQFLWQEGLNYAHGTGHGVGAFLGVHEGPQRISTGASNTALLENMILSNEPGVYLPGKFGIRIENLVYVKKADVIDQGFDDFYTFEDLTLVPYARNLIATELLTATEMAAVNAYHTRILEELGAALEVEALKWLIEATKPL